MSIIEFNRQYADYEGLCKQLGIEPLSYRQALAVVNEVNAGLGSSWTENV